MKPMTLLLALAFNTLASAAPNRAVNPAGIPSLPVAAIVVPAVNTPIVGLPGAAALPAALPAAGISAISQAIVSQIGAIAAPNATPGGAAQAGQDIATILQGGKPAPVADGSVSFSGVGGTGHGASGGAAPRIQIDDRALYAERRHFLADAFNKFGFLFSSPQAGPRLTEKLIAEAGGKDHVVSDIDDTITKWNQPLEPDMVEAIVAVRVAGKTFATITDRPSVTAPGSTLKPALSALDAIPTDKRQGIIIATDGGGRIFKFDAQGIPQLIFKEREFTNEEQAQLKEAADIVKSRLPAL